MKPFPTGKIFISEIHQRTLLQISHFSTSPNQFHSSPPSSYQNRKQEEESRNVRVLVWWDFENCTLPVTTNVFRLSQSITAAIRACGIKGPVQITAFGDVLQLSRSNQEALSLTGINLTHIPHGGKNNADRALLVDLIYWVSQNPPPAHLFLISGDRDFASILHCLRMNNYNILLASPDTAPGVLCSAASIMWHWSALVKGENLTGKHFNQPPDGPYSSWYGHYKLPLEDPFAVHEQLACSQTEEVPESGSIHKFHPVPKAVMKQICHILNLYPKGISITELRLELGTTNLSIDKDFYGYKKFSLFLLSMPHILKLESRMDGQHFVRGVAPKVTESSESIPGTITAPVTDNGDRNPNNRDQSSDNSRKINGDDEKPSLPLSDEIHFKEPLSKSPEYPELAEELPKKEPNPPPVVEKVQKNEVIESRLSPGKEHDEVGFFKRFWKKWFGGTEKSVGKSERYSSSSNSTEKVKEAKKKCEESTGQGADQVGSPSVSLSSNEAIIDENNAQKFEMTDDKYFGDTGFFNNVMGWFRLRRGGLNSDNPSEQYCEKMEQMNVDSGIQEIFSKESFWDEMGEFIDTAKGSDIFLQSRNRKQMAQNLQKQGPSTLRSLGEPDLLHLVDILVSGKKWVAEFPSQTFPFKLISPNGEKTSLSKPPSSNGLRSIFLGKSSLSSSPSVPENDAKRKDQIVPQNGPALRSAKSRGEMLADCENLINEIVKKYPEGFNLGCFRKLFLQKYQYSLDLKTLGYQKLATLLQIMSGVKIESSYVIPSGKSSNGSRENANSSGVENNNTGNTVNSHSELSSNANPSALENNNRGKMVNSDSEFSENTDSRWEVLGPILDTIPDRNEIGVCEKRKSNEPKGHDYESLLDDELSDLEDTLSSTGIEGQVKPRINVEDSSLLKILDSWYSSNEDSNGRRVDPDNVNGQAGCLGNGLKPSLSGSNENSGTPAENSGQKQRPSKSYSFVVEQIGDKDNRGKLIDGIFGTLKKSGDRSSVEMNIRG